MKIKKNLLLLLTLLLGVTLIGCGSKDEAPKTPEGPANPTTNEEIVEEEPDSVEGELKIWVGSESATFYQEVCDEWITKYNETHEKDFIGTIKVAGVDSSAAAAQYLQDTEAGADLFTVPHDNLGKLLTGSGAIAPIRNTKLINQMEDQCSDGFLDVCNLQAGDGSLAAYYAVPYISQALVLMYNKADFDGQEEKLQSFEGLLEVAQQKNKLAVSYAGGDGYNFSNFLLAQPYSADAKEAFGNLGSLLIYSKGIQTNNYNYGDDQVAIMKYAQRFITNPNGRNGELTSSAGWEKELQNGQTLGVITGAWNYGAACKAMGGEDKVGVTILPRFTLTAEDAYGKAKAGMVFQSGSFADCKCFVKKKDSKFAGFLDNLLLYLTSDEVQLRSYQECNNLPASQKIDVGDNALAAAQVGQSAYGIPQPFGFSADYNYFYYSLKGPALYQAIVQNDENLYSDDAAILRTLHRICWMWSKGTEPSSEEVLQKWITKRAADFE